MAARFHVAARKVSRVYGRQRALATTTVELDAGEAVALVGSNGAGKSTLCGILSTLVTPSTGAVRFDDGGDALGPRSVRASIGLCGHDSLCYGDLTGRENLELFARLYGVDDVGHRVDDLLARVALSDEAKRRPARTYSRGMLQRLALARALVHRPRFLILDEPFTGLDRGGVEMLAALLDEERHRGALLVVVSHDLDALAGLVSRVLVLRRGQLVFDGAAPTSGEDLRALYRRHSEATMASAVSAPTATPPVTTTATPTI